MPLGKTGIEFDIGKYNIRIVFRSSSERMFVCCFIISLSGLLQVFNACFYEMFLLKLLGRQKGFEGERESYIQFIHRTVCFFVDNLPMFLSLYIFYEGSA